jgi:hypothetical protein
VTSWIAALICLHGAFEGSFPAAAVVGRGGPDAAWAGEGDPLEANPALAALATGVEAGAGWTRPLDLQGVDLSGFWAHALLSSGTGMALRWRNLSAADIYGEDLASLDIAQSLGPFQLGGGWRWGRMEIAGKPQGSPLGWAAGATATPVGSVRLGASWEDLSGVRPNGLPQPWTFRTAAAAQGLDSTWNAQMGGELRQRGSWTWHAGQELCLDPIRLRMGLRVSPWTLCAGVGGIWKGVMIDYSLEDGPNLGLQHHGTVSWRW